jgi:uncharacterized protein YdaU (DUF1376 family)
MVEDIKLPYVDFYYSDFLNGTAHFSHQQKGIYIDLFCHAGTLNGRGLPNNFDQLCRIANLYASDLEKMEELKQDLTFVLNDKFTLRDDGKYHQNRQFVDRLEKVHKIKVKSANGSKGGLAKAKLKSSKASDSDSESLFINDIWEKIKYKRGSRAEAYKKYIIHATDIKPEIIVEKYNLYCSQQEEKKYMAHLSKWLKDYRWEEDLSTDKKEEIISYSDNVYKTRLQMFNGKITNFVKVFAKQHEGDVREAVRKGDLTKERAEELGIKL